ncbi:hypothetical protein ACIQZG_21585 [Lysinibacillus sp. NPDC096418]|uniref:hypothetical protein n=1 Tax=Lysinibacillus sp. NPDC096418 TaxID=3364138 RepID=UPI0037F6795C
MSHLGMIVAILVSAFMAFGIADYYNQPHNWYLFLLIVLTGFFIHIVILILKSGNDEEKEA